MATEKDVQAKRESVNALREQIAQAKQDRAAAAAATATDYRLARLTEEEQSLQAELAALKSAAPAPAADATAPSTKAAAAADNKE
jgi:PHD/YefM family antitoxin component YafN of YafNO toxin-antitoxin module